MFLYDFVQDYALSLILVALIVRLILLPFTMKGKRGMMRQSRLQPRIAELQKKHGANRQKLQEEQAKLFKEEGINPASGCLWNFIQMPIMIAVFFVIRQPLTLMMRVAEELLLPPNAETGFAGGSIYLKLQELNFEPVLGEFYVQIDQAQFISTNFEAFAGLSENLRAVSFNLGILNLASIPDWQFFWSPESPFMSGISPIIWLPGLFLFLLPIVSGGAQFISAGIMRKMNPAGSPEAAGGAAGSMMKLMPLMSVVFGFMFPAALSLYWTIGTVIQIGQDTWLTKRYTKILDEEDAEKAEIRKVKEAELEAKRIETERRKAEGLAERDRSTSKRKKKKGKKEGKRERAADWEKKHAPSEKEEKYEPGRVGNRRYARGRAYDPDRYSKTSGDDDDFQDDEEDYDAGEPVVDIDDEETSEIETYDDEDGNFEDDDYEDDDYEDEYEDEPDNTSSERFDTKRFD